MLSVLQAFNLFLLQLKVLSIFILRKELSENQRHCRQLQSEQQKNQPRPPLAKATRIDGGGDAEAAVQQLPHLYLRGRRDPLAAAAPP